MVCRVPTFIPNGEIDLLLNLSAFKQSKELFFWIFIKIDVFKPYPVFINGFHLKIMAVGLQVFIWFIEYGQPNQNYRQDYKKY